MSWELYSPSDKNTVGYILSHMLPVLGVMYLSRALHDPLESLHDMGTHHPRASKLNYNSCGVEI